MSWSLNRNLNEVRELVIHIYEGRTFQVEERANAKS